ncbi:hypothetical protein D9M72_436280 [compost metagenome]
MHHVEVGLLVPAAHVVGFAEPAFRKHLANCRTVIAHVQPVAHIEAVAINRQRLARQRIGDDQRDQLFREMVRAIVVGAVRRQHRQSIRMVIRTHQVIRGRLGCRVRAIGRVGGGFRELRVGLAQRAEHFIGGNVKETEVGLGLPFEAAPVSASRFQQREGANDIRLDELARTVDRPIHMAFGRKVNNSTRLVGREELVQCIAVTDIRLREHVPRIILDRRQRLPIARIGELVDVDDPIRRFVAQPCQNEIGANEPGAPSDQNMGQNLLLASICFDDPTKAERPPCPLPGRRGVKCLQKWRYSI